MIALTATAGAVDAVTFLGLGHAFAALATGNVLLLSFGVAKAPGIAIARPVEALAAFVAGVTVAHTVIVGVRGRGRRWFLIALTVEVALIAGAGLYAVLASGTHALPAHARVVVVVLLAGAMGWRNRAIVDVGISDMPTTVVQMSLVKALMDVLSLRSGSDREPVLARARRGATIFGIFAGGVTGALLLRLGPGPALIDIAGVRRLRSGSLLPHPAVLAAGQRRPMIVMPAERASSTSKEPGYALTRIRTAARPTWSCSEAASRPH
jgi:uncharacterized membrane protein YoaK (UPF0700 family)